MRESHPTTWQHGFDVSAEPAKWPRGPMDICRQTRGGATVSPPRLTTGLAADHRRNRGGGRLNFGPWKCPSSEFLRPAALKIRESLAPLVCNVKQTCRWCSKRRLAMVCRLILSLSIRMECLPPLVCADRTRGQMHDRDDRTRGQDDPSAS
jgi:hypothetical protein